MIPWSSSLLSFRLCRRAVTSIKYYSNIGLASHKPPVSFKPTFYSRLHLGCRRQEYCTMAPIVLTSGDPDAVIESAIKDNKVMIFSKSTCPFCHKVKALFKQLNVDVTVLELDLVENGAAIQNSLALKSGQRTVPNVYIKGSHLGGADDTIKSHQDGKLMKMINVEKHDYQYDLLVIGGGSGGLAASKEAAKLGAKVVVCDFVKPTPIGTTWGLGGTCVNVGCIPKKLMHQAAILGHELKDSKEYGWLTTENISHDMSKMVENIQNHIGSLNWGYKVALRDKEVDYLNAYATFKDAHTVKTVNKKGVEKEVSADKIIVAVGGRPNYPNIPGAKECCITSDDLFSLPYTPGKTLLVGASYIGLECAGFLAGIGMDVTVMVRSILLRGFDQDMANKIGDYMSRNGVKFIKEAVPTNFEKIEEGMPGKVKVTATVGGVEGVTEEYNTVILAIGRQAITSELGLEGLGVKTEGNGKIIVNEKEESSLPHIYAIGDAMNTKLELTPVAIQAGKLLARRLFGNSSLLTDYVNVPTTVFTPLEYGCCGLSEEDAIKKYGENNIEVYHANFWPLEFTVAHRPENDCYAKLICSIEENEKVVGFHYLGPNAGEVTQGFSLGLKLGATKADFDNLIGIHPTCAEVFTTMGISKRSGESIEAGGC